jgi:hypothetical protein
VRGVIKYHLEGTPPRFEDRALNLLFSNCKSEFDHNIDRYRAKVESCRENGKKGGAPKGNKNAVGNRGGGAPEKNQNAARAINKHNPAVEFEPEKQTQPKQADSDSELELELDNSGCSNAANSAEVVFSKQPETTTIQNFLDECKKAGFILDRKIAGEILNTGLDPAWLTRPFSFPECVAENIRNAYPDRPPAEQRRLFISALKWEDLREEYSSWRENQARETATQEKRQLQEAALQEKRRRIDQAKAVPPVTCGHCGAVLALDNQECPVCNYRYEFNSETLEYEFYAPINLVEDFRRRYMTKARL